MALPQGSLVLHWLISGQCEKIFLSETTRPRALIFGMKHHLVDFNQVCSNNAPWAKNGPAPGYHMFCIDLYRENMKKSSSLKPQGLEP